MGMMDQAWRDSARGVIDRTHKNKHYIVCATCKGNGYVYSDKLSPHPIFTRTCEDCGGSGHSGVKYVTSEKNP